MWASSVGVAGPVPSSITETRYCISDHLLWSAVPLVGGRSPLLRTPLPRSDTASRRSFKTFWHRGNALPGAQNAVGPVRGWDGAQAVPPGTGPRTWSLAGPGSGNPLLVDVSGGHPNRSRTERGARGGRPRGQHDEWPLARAFSEQGPLRTLVDLAGIEPASSGGLTGLL